MWKKLLITGCMAFCLLGGSALSAQPSCETKEEVTSEQLNRPGRYDERVEEQLLVSV